MTQITGKLLENRKLSEVKPEESALTDRTELFVNFGLDSSQFFSLSIFSMEMSQIDLGRSTFKICTLPLSCFLNGGHACPIIALYNVYSGISVQAKMVTAEPCLYPCHLGTLPTWFSYFSLL